jgi:hypothetical protein
MSKGDNADIQRMYDATAVWLRDCTRRGDVPGVQNAEAKLKELDAVLTAKFGEAV